MRQRANGNSRFRSSTGHLCGFGLSKQEKFDLGRPGYRWTLEQHAAPGSRSLRPAVQCAQNCPLLANSEVSPRTASQSRNLIQSLLVIIICYHLFINIGRSDGFVSLLSISFFIFISASMQIIFSVAFFYLLCNRS